MPRRKKHIDPVPAERLMTVIEDSGLSYAKFADRIEEKLGKGHRYTDSSVYRYAKAQNEVNPDFAQDVAATFGVNKDWLLGKSDFRTPLDESVARVGEYRARNDRRRLLFDLMTDMSGWSVEDIHVAAPWGESEVSGFPPHVAVSKGNVRHELSLLDYERFIGKMLDFCDFELSHMH